MTTINDVTDTAIWVAAYRAEENERKNALFRDPYAKFLIGENGDRLARRTQGSRYTSWSVIIRTCIIDEFILSLIKNEGIELVLNLGAGLDTRPYRLSLPSELEWIEVDFQKIIDQKNEQLKSFSPACKLERIALDLSVEKDRNILFQNVSIRSKKVLVITEGVIPYLSNIDAQALASDLFLQENFLFWITEYYSPEILKFLRTPKRLKQMENAPFLFYPEDWFGFFKKLGWDQFETKYFGVESEKLGRMPPVPGWSKESDQVNNKKDMREVQQNVKRYLGYSILKKSFFSLKSEHGVSSLSD
jgi:methyltransferase (TIGR00027 family)